MASFFALILFCVLSGYWIYRQQVRMNELHVDLVLSRSAQIRSDRISLAIHERIGDAQISIQNPVIQEATRSWRTRGYINDLEKSRIQEDFQTLKSVYGYRAISILDKNGNTLVSSEASPLPVEAPTMQVVLNAYRTKAIQISTIRSASTADQSSRIVDLVAPIINKDENGDIRAVLLLQFAPDRHFYSSLQTASFPDLPNDALLVQIQKGKVISLSDGHLVSSHHFLDVLAISPEQLYKSAANKNRIFIWRTRDGKEEIAAADAVEGTTWFVLTMIPKESVDAMAHKTVLTSALISAIMLSILGLGVVFWWKYKKRTLEYAALRAEASRRLLQQQYDFLSQYANDIIILTDENFLMIEANAKATEALDYPRSVLLGEPIMMLSPQSTRDLLSETLAKLRTDHTGIFETLYKRRNGAIFPVEVSARFIELDEKSYTQFICRDITERKNAESRIQSLAYFDSVTQLPNRTLLNDRLEHAIHMAARSDRKVGILFLDLDNFKNINDSLGHQIGDALLHCVGQCLLKCIREEDTVARIGGDEFLIMLPNLERGDEAYRVAEKVIASIAEPLAIQGHQIFTTTSVGISIFPDDSTNSVDLIKYADSALYEAKGRGRNNYQFFTRALNAQIANSAMIEHALRRALENDQLQVWYQPQVDMRDGKIVGVEALLRWRDGGAVQFSPNDFIPVAEERGLIARLGEWTLREACKQCRSWQSEGKPSIPVSVNVSQIQLQQKEFKSLIVDILTETDLSPSLLELEITETSVMKKAQAVADLAVCLRSSGIRFSIDDFGTGYSSLSYLKHIPIDKIKIDQSFIADMLKDTEDEAITEAIIRLAQSLHLRVVAEGVEQRAQLNRLLSLGCHEVQGFIYSEAVSSEKLIEMLSRENHFAGMTEMETG
jgi:diguanylate cyclase (GGDEF)-like protein/PAS domain S-box-containing protein